MTTPCEGVTRVTLDKSPKVCYNGFVGVVPDTRERTAMVTVRVPKAFVNDHDDRGLIERGLAAATVKATKAGYTLDLTPEEFSELLSDARYYAEQGCEVFGWEYRGLISSAKATVKAMEKVK